MRILITTLMVILLPMVSCGKKQTSSTKESDTVVDTAKYVNYLKENGMEPKEFVLNTLEKHKLVMYGELHFRQTSWDLFREVIKYPEFAQTTGTVFLELGVNTQKDLDRFFENKVIDTALLISVFQDGILKYGWMDKGMYEFLIDLWQVNSRLDEGKKITVKATDVSKHFNELKTKEEYDKYMETRDNRDVHMADVVEDYMKNTKDERNHLYIVGSGHVDKKLKNTVDGHSPELSAGGQLARRLPVGDVYAIFSHTPIVDNWGMVSGRISGGLFDYCFAALGNRPLAFDLKGSPFASEPYIVYSEDTEEGVGHFIDNYDGYIFLEPLEDEMQAYVLYEMFDDKFVEELKRRVRMIGDEKCYGIEIDSLTKEGIVANFKAESEGKKRWVGLLELK